MRQYHRSVARRLRLPCPGCGASIRRPEAAAREQRGRAKTQSQCNPAPAIPCPKCQGKTKREAAYIQCTQCSWRRQWKSFRKEQKRQDEKLSCPSCDCEFSWQAWKKQVGALMLGTGNAWPAQAFLDAWPQCRTPESQMMQIDLLIQAIHGQGAMAGIFIEGDQQSVRQLLDEIGLE